MKPSKELLMTIGVTVLCFLIMVPSRIIAPVWEFAKKEVNEGYNIRVQSFIGMLPLYQYSFYQVENTLPQESRAFLNMILNAVEAEDILVADANSASIEISENMGEIIAGVELENAFKDSNGQTEDRPDDDALTATEQLQTTEQSLPMEEPPATEQAPIEEQQTLVSETIPVLPIKKMEYDMAQFRDFELLKQEFYAIDPTTAALESRFNLDSLLGYDMRLNEGEEKPKILIYHTHSQEGFADSVRGDSSTTVVGAGEKLAEVLREYGFDVIHHTGEYDKDNRDYAYSKSAPALEQLLADNPEIEVIIDLHRDEVAEGTKLTTQIDGVTMAKFMFFNGLSYNSKSGDITYLKNDNLSENLAFSFQAQVIANEYYPGLTRRIYLRSYRYNMHYRGKSMLVELGAQTNTVEEVMNSIEPLGAIIAMTLWGYATQE